MPVSGLVLMCEPGRAAAVREAVSARLLSEVRDESGSALIVVTDTPTLDQDRAEVEALRQLDGVAAAHVVFSNIEDVTEEKL